MKAKTFLNDDVSFEEKACQDISGIRYSYQSFHQRAVIEQNAPALYKITGYRKITQKYASW